jgi:hypothetical protein
MLSKACQNAFRVMSNCMIGFLSKKLASIFISGMIPGLQQVMSATRGATDAFSGVTRHVNSAVR